MTTATGNFRRQHHELGQLASELLAQASEPALEERAGEVSSVLSKLAGRIRVHAAMEDDALYPRLLEHDDAEVRALGERFQREFGGIYDAFLSFRERWTRDAIATDPEGFRLQARGVVNALGARIQAENSELYARVDALFPV
ncbi:MAG: hemerythrin domain-containing protein [Polyangiales bacterium]|nr:hemerythrin domain-containing protein [Sandaracinaceae bacterium]